MIGLVILMLILVFVILTPARLTPIVNRVASDMLNAEVHFDTVNLTMFEEFPMVSLALRGGEVVSKVYDSMDSVQRSAITPRADTLMKFDELYVSGNLLDILRGKYSVRRVRVSSADIYAYVDQNGQPNWDIVRMSGADTLPDDSLEVSTPVDFAVNRVVLDNGIRLCFDSRVDSVMLNLDFNSFLVEGNITADALTSNLDQIALSKLKFNGELEREKLDFSAAIDTLGIMALDQRNAQRDRRYQLIFGSKYDLKVDSVEYLDEFPITFGGEVELQSQNKSIDLKGLTLGLDMIRFRASGNVSMLSDSLINSDMVLSVDSISLGRLLELVPSNLLPEELHDVRTNIMTSLECSVKGQYDVLDNRVLPVVKLDFQSRDGYLSYGDMKERLDRVVMDASLVFDPMNPDSTGIDISELILQGRSIDISMWCKVRNALRDPQVKFKCSGELNLDTLSVLFGIDHEVEMSGLVNLDMGGQFSQSQITSVDRLGYVDLMGRLKATNVSLVVPKDSLRLMMDGAQFVFGSVGNKNDSLMDQGLRVFRTFVDVDTLVFDKGLDYHLRVGRTHAGVRIASESITSNLNKAKGSDSVQQTKLNQQEYVVDPNTGLRYKARKRVHPFTGNFKGAFIQFTTKDSVIMRLRDGGCDFSIVPERDNPTNPLVRADIKAKALLLRSGMDRIRITRPVISLEASRTKYSVELLKYINHTLDSLSAVYPHIERDSLIDHARKQNMTNLKASDDLSIGDVDFHAEGALADIMRKFRLKGDIRAQRMRITTPYFPLRNVLSDVDISFSNSELNLRKARLESGASDLNIKGVISNIQRALLNKAILGIDVSIESDTLNVNELVQAANLGADYASGDLKIVNSEDDEALQKQLNDYMDSSENQNSLIIVPRNIRADMDLNIKYAVFSNLEIDSVSAGMHLRDRVLRLSDLYANTDAGRMSLSAIYATKSREDITTGFEFNMNQVQVEKLIELIPLVDSLTPMLRSFEGKVDCQIVATANVDTMMNIILPSLNAAARIKGQDLVLMDGETFAEISKMLFFKNKKRNVIDNISVEMLVRDSRMEMFPFVMEIDRYRAAVSGVHQLDMNFNYHISILKSPIPFRVGVDIMGNMDDFKFRIGRAKYKSEFVPEYVDLVDTTSLNLRRVMAQLSDRGLEAASDAPINITSNIKDMPMDGENDQQDLTALTVADSLELRRAGLLDSTVVLSVDRQPEEGYKQNDSRKSKKSETTAKQKKKRKNNKTKANVEATLLKD